MSNWTRMIVRSGYEWTELVIHPITHYGRTEFWFGHDGYILGKMSILNGGFLGKIINEEGYFEEFNTDINMNKLHANMKRHLEFKIYTYKGDFMAKVKMNA